MVTTPDHGLHSHQNRLSASDQANGRRMPLRRRTMTMLRDQRGSVAIESGFTLIILTFLFLGLVETFFLLEANRRVTDSAELTADLVAQQTSVTTSASVPSGSSSIAPISSLTSAAQLMLLPMTANSTNPRIDLASIYYNQSSVLSVDWEQTFGSPAATSHASLSTVYTHFSGGCTSSATSTCYCTIDPTTYSSAQPLCLINQSVDYVYIYYNYSNLFPYFAAASVPMTATGYAKPRDTSYVTMCSNPADQTTCN